ncbi:hypothetical protein [Candidatus Uabimicrobium sp. HlEnr_7]|uniref:hypothetical protein n=1 Tax=Candidatus Uabimicrobium helgolandensis TaxID=3095367 RepID=UPI00355652DF
MRYFILSLGCCLCLGCSGQIPFTNGIVETYQLTEKEVEGLQFYTEGDDIILQREVKKVNRDVGSSLEEESGSHIDEIIVEEGTPGIICYLSSDHIGVSFEKKFCLVFAKIQDGRYGLGYVDGFVNYYNLETGKTFQFRRVHPYEFTFIVIDESVLERFEKLRKYLPGRTVE